MRLICCLFLLTGSMVFADYTSQGYEYPTLQGSDEDIEQQVSLALQQNRALQGSNIQINVDNGQVTLTGTVKSDSDKVIAGSVANSVSGVSFVQNQLVISPK